ncbi:MAG TPA: hypothetical protein VL172_18980, partial [Kofleriaceae bacterium]|nr:hypothetical protein [Kofleriaceae bacterium]
AVACFVKVFGTVFLGEPRTPAAERAHESGPLMTVPMAVLAALCFVIGLAAPLIAPVLDHAAAAWAPELAPRLTASADLAPLPQVAFSYLPFAALLLGAGLWLAVRARRAPARVGTWDCGYAAPAARMQYTASSFAQMVVSMFGWALRPHTHRPQITAPFPGAERFESHVDDTVLDALLIPAGRRANRWLGWWHWMQRGSAHVYLLYILATLVLLLLWKGG